MAAGAVETMQDSVHTSIKAASPRRVHTEPTIREQQFPVRALLVPPYPKGRLPPSVCLAANSSSLSQPFL